MIKGLAITPPILGRISIGRVVEKNGKRLPEKDDQFTITSQVQNADGWVNHPIDEALRKESSNGKIRSIPIRLLFNEPDLNLRAEYSLFDRKSGRPLCVGNGETCRRFTGEGIQSLPCPSPDLCELAKGGACKPYGRLNVVLGDDDELGTFIFRTTGFNSIRSLTARLHYYQALSGNLLSCLPLELKLRGKSTAQSYRAPIYYVDITIREGMKLMDAIESAKVLDIQRKQLGYLQPELDAAARNGFINGAFEESSEDLTGLLEEFFQTSEITIDGISNNQHPTQNIKSSLCEKLDKKLQLSTENQFVNSST
ncbi:hydrolase or metal-binding protein [Undibacterium seohonense]|uniref:Hydrolase or metal-binding protein n=1 Tax=Undibacterium seohonense TaxID=1344950 RepID=A0ABR6X8P1_9BURK|nr:hydrolase or metal-binding protein [Undibacterium seohonense]MBC3809274.1 hydrolase or metal-binding protein [Undibacterium seohonense]